MENDILNFIKKRFPSDCNWLDGNCYYFSIILKSRFPQGTICYDVINGHFLFRYGDSYYDWNGKIKPNNCLVKWDQMEEYDSLQKERVIRDCIM